MSLKSYNNEGDWERRKAKLIRSLFQDDIPPQSSDPDEESLVSYISRTAPSDSAFTEYQPERPCSPLPPLIIEIEPNRHDEPEEYYQKLEKKIMKVYRRMFIEDRSDASKESDSDSIDMDKRSMPNSKYCERRDSFGVIDSENVFLQNDANDMRRNVDINDFELVSKNDSKENNHSQENYSMTKDTLGSKFKSNNKSDQHSNKYVTEEQKSSSSEFSPIITTEDLQKDVIHERDIRNSSIDSEESPSDSDETNVIEKEKKTFSIKKVQRSNNTQYFSAVEDTAENRETSTSSESGVGFRQITFKADVHRDATEVIIQKAPSLVYEQNIREEIVSNINIVEVNDELDQLKEKDISDNNHITLTDGSEGDELQEIETMRAANVCTSIGSLQNKHSNHSQCSVNELNERSRSLEAQTRSESSIESVFNVMKYEESIDYDMLYTRLTQEEISNENAAPNITMTRKRKTSSSRSSSAKTVKYADVGIQTNAEDEYLNQRILCDNIFMGVPRVFKLCSCVNHLCSC